MDILQGMELERFQQSALHTSRIPRTVLQAGPGGMFEEIEERNSELIGDFARRRSASQRLSTFGGGGDVLAAIPRFYSPQDYFVQSQIPYKISDDKQRAELMRWMDLFYRTHPLVPILVDIFTRFPLVGMELDGPDRQLNQFYTELFFDDLQYDQLLVDIGREYWTLGESWPLGHFDESLGVWGEEELLDPTLVTVKKFPIMGTEEFFLTPPPELVELCKRRAPEPLYHMLKENHADIIPFLLKGKPIPVSDVLLKQIAFKASTRDLHGTPILLRVLRQLIHEEKLMAAQDAVAERLYSPLLLVKLGVQDMGPNRGPWIPGPEHVASLRNDLDIALAADFRILVHHFGIEVHNVWGREQMPRLDMDFDRVDRKLCMTFGINPNLLAGGASAQPYASSALQAEFLNQILRTYQKYLKRFYEMRAAIVAEAQGHFAYEKRGDTRIPIVEEIVETDPETGEDYIRQVKKLMYPELNMKVLDLRDEATQRQFLQTLKQAGVPVPDEDLAMGMGYIFTEALDQVQEELIQKTVAQQDAKVKAYDILSARGLPIPPDLKQEVEGAGIGPPQPGEDTSLDVNAPEAGDSIPMPPMPGGGGMGMPPGGGMMPGMMPGGMPGMMPGMGVGMGGGLVQPMSPYNPMRGTVPEQSTNTSPLMSPARMMSRVASTSSEHLKEAMDEVVIEGQMPKRLGKNNLKRLQEFDMTISFTDDEESDTIHTDE